MTFAAWMVSCFVAAPAQAQDEADFETWSSLDTTSFWKTPERVSSRTHVQASAEAKCMRCAASPCFEACLISQTGNWLLPPARV